MIVDIPKHTDFSRTAVSFLNLGWETTLDLSITLDRGREYDSEVSDTDYWAACQTQLATAISLVQQANEFLLKARIAEVSPFLLIGGTPKEWPKGCSGADTPFADFYAIDAQELVRAHDTVAPTRLPPNMKDLFEKMRRLRNSIIHTVDKRLKLEVKQVIVAILEISEWAIGGGKWIETRLRHMEESPSSLAFSSDHTTCHLAEEIQKVVDMLKPSETARFLGFDKKQRRYICPECVCSDCDLEPAFGLLAPNTPDSENLHCFLCGRDHAVLRQPCDEPGCKGNVLDAADECCLTCYR